MRYNLATLAELRVFEPLPYTLELDGAAAGSTRCWSPSATAPSFGGGLRITEGAVLDDGLLDVVIIKPMSKPEPGPDLPQAVQGHPRHAPAVRAPPGAYRHGRGTRHRVLRRRRAVRRPAPHHRVRPRSAERPCLSPTAARPSGTPTTGAAALPRVRTSPPLRLPARRLPGPGLPGDRGRPRRAGRRARPAPARRSSASSPSTWRSTTGRKCFYTTPIKALSNQKYNDLVARYGEDQVGLLTGDNTSTARRRSW